MIIGSSRNHIEFYVSIIILVAVSIYDIFRGSDDLFIFKLLIPAITAIYYGVFKIQYLLDEIKSEKEEGSQNSPLRIVTAFPEDFSDRIRKANKIEFMGVHPNSIISDYADDFEYAIRVNKAEIHCIMVPIDSESARMTASRFTENEVSLNKEKNRIQECHCRFSAWKTKFPDATIEVFEKDYLFEKACLMLDLGSSRGIVYEQRYTFRVNGGSKKPKFIYTASSEWIDLIRTEFDEHRLESIPVKI
jgi:hypothetical protein